MSRCGFATQIVTRHGGAGGRFFARQDEFFPKVCQRGETVSRLLQCQGRGGYRPTFETETIEGPVSRTVQIVTNEYGGFVIVTAVQHEFGKG